MTKINEQSISSDHYENKCWYVRRCWKCDIFLKFSKTVFYIHASWMGPSWVNSTPTTSILTMTNDYWLNTYTINVLLRLNFIKMFYYKNICHCHASNCQVKNKHHYNLIYASTFEKILCLNHYYMWRNSSRKLSAVIIY